MKKVTLLVTLIVLEISPVIADAHPTDPQLLRMVPDVPSQNIPDKPGQIRRGKQLFESETFGGNGRTCATCHGSTENFTLNAADIARRPASDPLFVFERVPDLATLENGPLLRQFGLICEPLDGFDKPCVLRGVPHTLALPTSIKPDPAQNKLVNALGLSGDGSPSDGSLRNFALGAIVVHFTKDLLRRPGIDFLLPSKQELQQMEAFQLTLGRQEDVSLDGDDAPAIIFKDASAEAGKVLFLNAPSRNGAGRSCASCHDEAGANNQAGLNKNFDTGTRLRPTSPACLDPNVPGDGGLGLMPIVVTLLSCGRNAEFRGNGTFNTPPLVEAADTPPFFHNNTAATLEDAIAHYTTDIFNNSPAGNGNAFVLNAMQIGQISAMLRTLNAMENIRDSIARSSSAISQGKHEADDNIRVAIKQTMDAFQVISESPIRIYRDTNVRPQLLDALVAQQRALVSNGAERDTQLRNALSRLATARGSL